MSWTSADEVGIGVDLPVPDLPEMSTRFTESPLGDGRDETARRGPPPSVTLPGTTTSSRWRPGALEATVRAARREVAFRLDPGTGHGFVEPNRPETSAPAADLAREPALAFEG